MQADETATWNTHQPVSIFFSKKVAYKSTPQTTPGCGNVVQLLQWTTPNRLLPEQGPIWSIVEPPEPGQTAWIGCRDPGPSFCQLTSEWGKITSGVLSLCNTAVHCPLHRPLCHWGRWLQSYPFPKTAEDLQARVCRPVEGPAFSSASLVQLMCPFFLG